MDTRTPAEIAYDQTRLSPAPIAPADDLPDDLPLTADEEALIAILLPTLRAAARDQWEGTVTYGADGELHRSPDLPAQPIATLPDGSPILGSFDTDDQPFTVHATIGGFDVIACDRQIIIDTGPDSIELTLAQWAALRDIAASGAIDKIISSAAAWIALNNG